MNNEKFIKIAFFLSAGNVVPPPKTGGIEQSAYYLLRELEKRGHKITLFAASGSNVQGVEIRATKVEPAIKKIEQANLEERIYSFYDNCAITDFFCANEWKNYDLIHFGNYIFYEIIPFAKYAEIPIIIEMNYPHTYIYRHVKDRLKNINNVHFLPVSKFIKKLMPGLRYLSHVYPFIEIKDFSFSKQKREYLLCIGRICPEKGTHLALKAALQAKEKLVIAGKVNKSNFHYFNTEIKPYVDNKNIIYIGEVAFKTKIKIYQKAIATLFPIQWDEPFGSVLVESMACGTPVIAFDRSAVREIVKDKVGGCIVADGNIEVMAKAVKRASGLDKKKIRAWAEKRFSLDYWIRRYEEMCLSLIKK